MNTSYTIHSEEKNSFRHEFLFMVSLAMSIGSMGCGVVFSGFACILLSFWYLVYIIYDR